MSKIAHAALAASLALAALPAFALATAAHAAPAEVRIADLDLATAQGAAAFEQRVDAAARRYCRDHQVTGTRVQPADCIEAVRAEMKDKLGATLARQGAARGYPVASR